MYCTVGSFPKILFICLQLVLSNVYNLLTKLREKLNAANEAGNFFIKYLKLEKGCARFLHPFRGFFSNIFLLPILKYTTHSPDEFKHPVLIILPTVINLNYTNIYYDIPSIGYD